MPLSAGDIIGSYQILAPLGAGGMGEVYRARDNQLGREVAIKVLPDTLASDPERLARFDREAKILATLNHPNIATIHGLAESGGRRALVMELVAGEPLRGPLPLETAVDYAKQIVAALEAAHDKGVIHRDLKPANIIVTPDGEVKVLDFGLAKAVDPAASAFDRNSPTLTLAATRAGVIVGTAAYMSPEQAVGKTVDKRSDIWSFGVVLWEMLTGRRLFEGETVTQTLAEVLRGEIDFKELPRETPAAVRGLLRRCLDRNAKTRLRDIGEARVALDRAFEPAEAAVQPAKHRIPFVWIGASAVLAILLVALALAHFREGSPVRQRVRAQISQPEGLVRFQLSPDGRFLLFVTIEGETRKIWIRALDSLDFQMLTEIPGKSRFVESVSWSPDGEQIVFREAGKLYRIGRAGGPPFAIADSPNPGGWTAVWLDGGVIVFTTGSATFRVPASGGAVEKVSGQPLEGLSWLPGRRFLYAEADGISAGSLDSGKPVRVLANAAGATYVPPRNPGMPGHLLFLRQGVLLAQPFSADKLELRGDPIPVEQRVSGYTASTSGVLVIDRQGPDHAILTWLDRAGKTLQRSGAPFSLPENPAIRLSPDDSRAIVTVAGPESTDLWIADFRRDSLSRFTFEGSWAGIWSPDGRNVLWGAFDGSYNVKAVDGSGKVELLFKVANGKGGYPTDWSSDGQLVTLAYSGENSVFDIWLCPTGGDRRPYPYRQSRFASYWGQFSPDSHWMAYTSEESPEQVFVESIPQGKARVQVSTEGGDWPIWRRDGKELFYRQGTKIMAAPIRLTETSVESGKPQMLFDVPAETRFQVSRDGQRFLIALPVEGASATPKSLIVDTDWRAGLAK